MYANPLERPFKERTTKFAIQMLERYITSHKIHQFRSPENIKIFKKLYSKIIGAIGKLSLCGAKLLEFLGGFGKQECSKEISMEYVQYLSYREVEIFDLVKAFSEETDLNTAYKIILDIIEQSKLTKDFITFKLKNYKYNEDHRRVYSQLAEEKNITYDELMEKQNHSITQNHNQNLNNEPQEYKSEFAEMFDDPTKMTKKNIDAAFQRLKDRLDAMNRDRIIEGEINKYTPDMAKTPSERKVDKAAFYRKKHEERRMNEQIEKERKKMTATR